MIFKFRNKERGIRLIIYKFRISEKTVEFMKLSMYEVFILVYRYYFYFFNIIMILKMNKICKLFYINFF